MILLKMLKFWLPLAAVITLFCGLIYATVQQSYRMDANDPQIQMAEDTARALESGQPASSLVPSGKVDIAQSLAPYLIIYDTNGQAAGFKCNTSQPDPHDSGWHL